jgi:hypothetical protein
VAVDRRGVRTGDGRGDGVGRTRREARGGVARPSPAEAASVPSPSTPTADGSTPRWCRQRRVTPVETESAPETRLGGRSSRDRSRRPTTWCGSSGRSGRHPPLVTPRHQTIVAPTRPKTPDATRRRTPIQRWLPSWTTRPVVSHHTERPRCRTRISVRERHRCRRSVTRSVTNTSASGVSPNAARGRSLAPVAAPWRDPSIRADRRYPIRRRPTYRTKLYPSKNMVWRYIAAALGYNSRHGTGARRKPAGPIPRKNTG